MALSKPVKVDMFMSNEITQKLDVHEIENYSQYFVAVNALYNLLMINHTQA